MEKKQIVFSESYSTVMVYKMSKSLREKGYKTVLIRLLEQNEEDNKFYNPGFDKIINFNISHFYIGDKKHLKENVLEIIKQIKKIKNFLKCFLELLRLKDSVYIGRAKINLPVFFFRIIFFRKNTFIYFPYDIRNHNTVENNKSVPFYEIYSEKYCLEHADGIIHKGAPEELEPKFMDGRSLGNNLKIQKLRLNFHPYCSNEFIVPINKNKLSKKDKEWHFVYVGGIKKPNLEFYQSLLDYNWLLKHKVHIHFYFCSDTKKQNEDKKNEEAVKKFFEVNKDYPYIRFIHFHDSFDPKTLESEISKYDVGIIGDPVGLKPGHLDPILTTANKISSYFEAGIPILYSKKYWFINELMKKYHLDILGYSDIDEIGKILKKIDYKKIENNVIEARKDYLMEKHADRLEKFINQAIESSKKI
jgi:hypothetical protein